MTMHVHDPGFDYRAIPKSKGGGIMAYAKEAEDRIYRSLLNNRGLCRHIGLDEVSKLATKIAYQRKPL